MNVIPRLKEDWKQAWRWLSAQLGALIVIAPQVYDQADVLQRVLPPGLFKHIMSALGVLVILNSLRRKA